MALIGRKNSICWIYGMASRGAPCWSCPFSSITVAAAGESVGLFCSILAWQPLSAVGPWGFLSGQLPEDPRIEISFSGKLLALKQ
jgi:hypothetical protein